MPKQTPVPQNPIDLLNELKGLTVRSLMEAHRGVELMALLSTALKPHEFAQLMVAKNKYEAGHGRTELDTLCNQFINNYRGNPPARKTLTLA